MVNRNTVFFQCSYEPLSVYRQARAINISEFTYKVGYPTRATATKNKAYRPSTNPPCKPEKVIGMWMASRTNISRSTAILLNLVLHFVLEIL
jgi:hypothetical protein